MSSVGKPGGVAPDTPTRFSAFSDLTKSLKFGDIPAECEASIGEHRTRYSVARHTYSRRETVFENFTDRLETPCMPRFVESRRTRQFYGFATRVITVGRLSLVDLMPALHFQVCSAPTVTTKKNRVRYIEPRVDKRQYSREIRWFLIFSFLIHFANLSRIPGSLRENNLNIIF